MANDIVNINVSETVETVAITVNPNLTTVNINRQVPVGVNGQDLQSVTDIGSVTTNSITANSFIKSGGTSNQFLKANGTVDSSVYTTAQNLQSVTNLGATTTNGINIDTEDTYEIGLYAISSAVGIKGESRETYGVYGTSDSSAGVYGFSGNEGVIGQGSTGVKGIGTYYGVEANSYNEVGVFAQTGIGIGVSANSESDGTAIYAYSTSGKGIEVYGNGTISVDVNLGSTNKGVVIDSGTSSTGNPIEVNKNGVNKLTVNQAGEITATKLIKQGGTSSQLLAANGDSITAGTNITISGGTISSTGGGGGATNLTTSQTASNFTINSDTGTDASVPLGNGTLAGATLNDYTTAEKNKLAGIATGAEVNVNADWNATSGDAEILNKPALEQILSNGNQAENVIGLTYSGLGSMSYGGYSTSYTDTTDRNITLFYVEGISAGGLSFALPSNKADGEYILATVDDIIDGVPYTGATSNVDLGLNDITATKLIKQGGTSSQILAADGSVITAGTNITITGGQISSVGGAGGGGSSVNYYLNGGTSQGTFGGTTYYEFSKTAVIGTGADFNISSNGYIASFITDVADPSLLLIPAGNWNLEFFFSSSSAGGSPSFYVELYKYDGTTFTSIASSSATPEGITNGTAIDAYFTPLAVPETVLTINDRLAIRVYVNASSKTITLHTQNGHLCEVITTFTAGLTALNGLQAQVQNFATGTTGTDFAINSSGSTHTFNLPSASASNRGALSSANWTTFNNKQDTLTAGNGINITTNTISTVDTSRAAYTMLANNTNASAIPTTQPFENLTNQVYSGTIVWTGGTAPSGTTDHTYSLSQIGNLVTLTINLAYGTASGGTVSSVTMELPSTAPTPALPSSVTTALDVVNYGAGMIISSKVLATTAAAFCALRLKSTSPNVFEIVISRVASTHRYAYAMIQYFV